jgi:hypothetical protein
MICATEDFLLIVQKWITDSATVKLLLLLGPPGEPFLGVSLRGRIRGIDPSLPAFIFTTGADPDIAVDLRGWQIGFADKTAPEPLGENADEAFILNRPNVSIALWTLQGA